MPKKKASQLVLFLLFVGLLTHAFNIQSASASGTIYIRANGSIDPPTAPIQRNVDVYTFTDDIQGSIIVEKDNIVLDGAGHTLQGTGEEIGIDLSLRTNVKIQNVKIRTFYYAVYLSSSSHVTISGTNITDSTDGILVSDSSNNCVYENNIAGNAYEGIYILTSSNNTISENNITVNTGDGVYLWGSSNNTIVGNNVSNNWWGVASYYSSNNRIFHNNFINNPSQASSESSVDIWDGGYLSGGNYWSDYASADIKKGPNQDQPGSDGIGDTPYIIDSDNRDRYPLMNLFGSPSPPTYALAITSTAGGTITPVPGTYTYSQGQNVPVQAVPSSGYILNHWELDGINIGAPNPVTVTMNTNHNLHAVFIPTYSVTIKAHCITEGADVGVTITMDGSPTGYTTPYTFAGLTGTHTFTVPTADPNGHPLKQWNTGETSTTITVTTGGTYMAYYRTPTVHAVAITSVMPSKTVVGQGYSMSADITVLNPGDYTETFNVTLYANTTFVALQTITLESGAFTTITFTWNTAGFAKGNYIISAYAWPLRDETDVSDNNCTNGWISVTIPGDVDGNFEVDIYDITAICVCYDSKIGPPSDPLYYPNCDLDGNGIIDIFDVTTACITYGQKYP